MSSNPLTITFSRRRTRVIALVAVLMFAAAACQTWPVQPPFLNSADRAAAWIVTDHQVNGSSYTPEQRVDALLALVATNADVETGRPVLAGLEAATPGYVRPGGTFQPGPTARVILAVQAARGDPTTFAGLDLVAGLRSTLRTSGTNSGRFGTADALDQGLAMVALARTAEKIPASATTWLAARQCATGGFSSGACGAADVDTTASAGAALWAVGGDYTAAANRSAQWLLDHQNPDGGFGTGGSNPRSSGRAAQLLRATNHATEAAEAGQWVWSLQIASGPNTGAIRWSATTDGDLRAATTGGVLTYGAGPWHQTSFPSVVGQPCPTSNGVTVIVDFTRFDNTIKMTCATGPQPNGWKALESAGFTLGSVPMYPGQAICTINQLPKEGYPTCWWTGFWSYWHDETRSGEWTFSEWGAAARTPPPGSVEGWRYEPDLYNHLAAPPSINPLWPA